MTIGLLSALAAFFSGLALFIKVVRSRVPVGTDETELAETERLAHQLCHERGICDLKPPKGKKSSARQLRKRLDQAIRDVPKDFGARKR